MNTKAKISICLGVIVIIVGAGLYFYASGNNAVVNNAGGVPVKHTGDTSLTYTNTDYGFTFTLPADWQGYTIVKSTWQGNPLSGATAPSGPKLLIRNPHWTASAHYEDIPILVFTVSQWNSYLAENFSVSAAPVKASELARNNTYVFALPPRWDYDYSLGYKEADDIVTGSPLHAFNLTEKPAQPFAYPAGLMGYAISWAQCGEEYPKPPYDFGVLDVTGGRSLTHNRCLKSEFEWASKAPYPPTFYINLTYPTLEYRKGLGPHEYGYETARDAYAYAVSQDAQSPLWWLDVQTKSTWADDTTVNQAVAQGAIDFFNGKKLSTGLSTTPYQWAKIMGDFNTGLPNWIPGIPGKAKALEYCQSGKSYSGGSVQQLADILPQFETVYTCGD